MNTYEIVATAWAFSLFSMLTAILSEQLRERDGNSFAYVGAVIAMVAFLAGVLVLARS